MPAVADTIETDIQNALLRLVAVPAVPIPATSMRVGELPKANEEVDLLPALRVAPQATNNLSSKPAGTDAGSMREYRQEVCLIYPREGDNTSDQPAAQAARRQVLNLIERDGDEFRVGLAGVPAVWSVEIDHSATFDRSKLAKQYAYLSVAVVVRTTE